MVVDKQLPDNVKYTRSESWLRLKLEGVLDRHHNTGLMRIEHLVIFT